MKTYMTIPVPEGKEKKAQAITMVSQLLLKLWEQEGTIVEAEQIIGMIQKDGFLKWHDWEPRFIIHSRDVRATRGETMPYEIHYAIDFPNTKEDTQPIRLQDLQARIDVGWFSVYRNQRWCYRSNFFHQGPEEDIQEVVKQQMKDLTTYLDTIRQEYDIYGMVEMILGIWKCKPKYKEDDIDLYELAFWEQEKARELLKNNPESNPSFWITLSNFFFDKTPLLKQVIQNNLSHRIKYTYFLSSFADAVRWTQATQDDFKYYIKDKSLRAFRVSNPPVEECVILRYKEGEQTRLEGVKMISKNLEFCKLEWMKPDELTQIAKTYFPVAEFSDTIKFPIEFGTIPKAVVLRLNPCVTHLEKDTEIARIASIHCCSHITYQNSYTIFFLPRKSYHEEFHPAKMAVECALQLSKLLPNCQVAIGHGDIKPVVRSYGQDYEGDPLDWTRRLLKIENTKQIVVCETVWHLCLGNLWFVKTLEFSRGLSPEEVYYDVHHKKIHPNNNNNYMLIEYH